MDVSEHLQAMAASTYVDLWSSFAPTGGVVLLARPQR
jgi:hypothetical protein